MSFYVSLLRILPLAFLRSIAKVAAYFINQNPDKSMLWKTRVNLSLTYPDIPESEREKLAKESVTKQCLSYIESGKCWAMPPEWTIQEINTVHQIKVLTGQRRTNHYSSSWCMGNDECLGTSIRNPDHHV